MTALPDTSLLTIGYEGRTPDEFVAVLHRNGVTKVVDVRQLPLSRKRGFSKTALSCALAAHGIEYVSMRELGTPAEVRKQYRDSRDFGRLAQDYLSHLAEHDDTVEELYSLAVAAKCCLLCFERQPERCHRSLLAEVVASRNGRQFEICHL